MKLHPAAVLNALPMLLLTLALSACAPGPAKLREPAAPTAKELAALRLELATLPGAETAAGTPLSTTYPGENLFATGAALPLPGGTAMLDPLTDLLKAHPEIPWRLLVRAETGDSEEYDSALAKKRAEVLLRYFGNRGIAPGLIEVVAASGGVPPLEITLK